MDEEFVPYELALRLKELGFDKSTFGGWCHPFNNHKPYLQLNQEGEYDITAPTFSQAFRWFREKHNLFGKIYITNFGADEYSFNIYDLYEEEYKYENFIAASMSYAGTFETYEEAELACLEKLIEIV